MYVVKCQTSEHYGSWDEFIGIFESLDDAIPTMKVHHDFYGFRFHRDTWKPSDEGLQYISGKFEYTAIKVELS